MKPFNLEQAKAQNGEGLITRDGRPARIVCWDAKDNEGDNYLVALVKNLPNESETPFRYDKKGFYLGGDWGTLDLFLAPTKHEGWVNVYEKDKDFGRPMTHIFRTKAEADDHLNGRVACIHIEWEE